VNGYPPDECIQATAQTAAFLSNLVPRLFAPPVFATGSGNGLGMRLLLFLSLLDLFSNQQAGAGVYW